MSKELTVISAERQDGTYWRDIWRERELFYFLAWRDLLVRYKQTIIGVAWTVLRPLASILVYTFVFGILAQLPSEGVPYTLVVLTGLLPWQLFSLVLIVSSDSLLANAHLVQKIYFPRLVIPLSSVVVCVVDHLIAFLLVFGLMLWFGLWPKPQFLLLPFVTLLAVACALGLGLIAAALNTRYRDLRQLIPIVLQVGVFICPVAYLTSLVSPKWQMVYALNPMVGIIDAFRWCILGRTDIIYPPSILVSIVFAVASVAVGIKVFRKMEDSFPDMM
ncbi:ABC transporter permease [Bosea sp. BH3]|uniref:ABC transporter permease n=1 Tax=Bosea sp. BH3 TaxID=2871701 RepID=UPI0021CAFA15|nr:ABC transporter permease [Bosea sp. BH3]MCU4181248.1 ABC transporter permease [Bosea sp. BH3]